eukprot:INCI2994.1.p1 GENE.INCI2994.1~~INCI2994.1.p1  ORF type:complete len:316 (+),score=49.32 INCI2994.1:628-1575(+)
MTRMPLCLRAEMMSISMTTWRSSKKKRNCEWPLTLQEYDADPSLGEWVFRMRRRSLSRFQFNVLNNMNFFWKGPQSKGECSNDFHETMQGQNKDDQISQNEAAPPHRLKLKLGTRKRKGRRYQSRVKKQGQGPRLDGRCKKWNRNFEKLKSYLDRQHNIRKLRQNDFKLNSWLGRQKQAYKHEIEARDATNELSGSERITQDQIERLESLGISLNTSSPPPAQTAHADQLSCAKKAYEQSLVKKVQLEQKLQKLEKTILELRKRIHEPNNSAELASELYDRCKQLEKLMLKFKTRDLPHAIADIEKRKIDYWAFE